MRATDFHCTTAIAAAPEQVWEALTEARLTAQFWFNLRIDSTLKQGAAIALAEPDGRIAIAGEITRLERPYELAFSWRYTDLEDPASLVVLRLEALDVGTLLSVMHTDLAAESATRAVDGWPLILSGLKTLLETPIAVDFSAALPYAEPLDQIGAG